MFQRNLQFPFPNFAAHNTNKAGHENTEEHEGIALGIFFGARIMKSSRPAEVLLVKNTEHMHPLFGLTQESLVETLFKYVQKIS